MGLWQGIKDVIYATKEIFLPEPQVIVLPSRTYLVEERKPDEREELKKHVEIIAAKVQDRLFNSYNINSMYIAGHLGIRFRESVLLSSGEAVWIGYNIDCPLTFKGLQFPSLINNTYVPIITKFFTEQLERVSKNIVVLRVEACDVHTYDIDGYTKPPAYYLRVIYGIGSPAIPTEKPILKSVSKGKKKK